MGIAGTAPVTRGKHFKVEALVLTTGEVPARAFLTQFTKEDGKWFRQQARMLASIDVFANTPHGRFLNREMFKAVENSKGVFAFKAFQLRLYCFYAPGGRLILAFGVIKQKDKHDARDIRRAEELRDEFLKTVK